MGISIAATSDGQVIRAVLTLSLPPTDNHTHMSVGRARVPTREYKDWIALESVRLNMALRKAGVRESDKSHWWAVRMWVTLPDKRRDFQNHEKAILDLLSGACMDGGRILHCADGGVWDNDNRVYAVEKEHDGWGDEGSVVVAIRRLEDGPSDCRTKKKKRRASK